ncbi:MAG: hypothetical protein M3Y27_05150, partial [Acidobacteriota bacterium]|nr:hypothetical protein [Acidobacteriota bacterium]
MPSLRESLNLFQPDEPGPPEGPLKKVQLITDGACIGNPGPGGWACVLRYGDHKKELYGFDKQTTNNRMELM